MLFGGCRECFAPVILDEMSLFGQKERNVGAKLGAKTLNAYRYGWTQMDKNALV